MTNLSQQEKERKLRLANETRPGKEFWDNEAFVEALDLMAKRYGRLPTELLDLTLHEWELNVAIMAKSLEIEKDRRIPKTPALGKSWKDLGIGYAVKE